MYRGELAHKEIKYNETSVNNEKNWITYPTSISRKVSSDVDYHFQIESFLGL